MDGVAALPPLRETIAVTASMRASGLASIFCSTST